MDDQKVPIPEENNCANCGWWTRMNDESGECSRYAPPITAGLLGFRQAERPITPQYWRACGDWKRKNENLPAH